jgi:hypothetical protein
VSIKDEHDLALVRKHGLRIQNAWQLPVTIANKYADRHRQKKELRDYFHAP